MASVSMSRMRVTPLSLASLSGFQTDTLESARIPRIPTKVFEKRVGAQPDQRGNIPTGRFEHRERAVRVAHYRESQRVVDAGTLIADRRTQLADQAFCIGAPTDPLCEYCPR